MEIGCEGFVLLGILRNRSLCSGAGLSIGELFHSARSYFTILTSPMLLIFCLLRRVVGVLACRKLSCFMRGGELELAAPRPAVRKILAVTGLAAVFTVAGSPDA